jgi:hypothetical protein
LTWAQRLKRVFAIDIEVCRRCGGKLRVIAGISGSVSMAASICRQRFGCNLPPPVSPLTKGA